MTTDHPPAFCEPSPTSGSAHRRADRAAALVASVLGKGVRWGTRLLGGSGSTLPGLVVERLVPRAVPGLLAQLPRGVVLVTGTNGKTTTTMLLTALLRDQGLRVATNPTGSNFVRGVASALVDQADLTGRLRADVAVLELDEAHAARFVALVRPRCVVLLNVVRDQLDRFAETDGVADLLAGVARRATEAVVLNVDDPHLRPLAGSLPEQRVTTFGAAPSWRSSLPVDPTCATATGPSLPSLPALPALPTPAAPSVLPARPAPTSRPTVAVERCAPDGRVTFAVPGGLVEARWRLAGAHNALNAAAALAATHAVLGSAPDPRTLAATLAAARPAFGRGERFVVDGEPVEIVLVKNPCGFQAALGAHGGPGGATLVAVNDAYADSKDTSWLWDVDFSGLRDQAVHVSGSRADDVALRLAYDDVPVSCAVNDVPDAVRAFVDRNRHVPKRVFCTYTAMLEVRSALGATRRVEAAQPAAVHPVDGARLVEGVGR